MKKSDILFVVMFLVIILWTVPEIVSVKAVEVLYFDDDGDFIFAMHDKKATSGTKYRTIGWNIKRYDLSLYDSRQMFITLANPSSYYEVEDKDKPGYVYTYFIISSDKVKSSIKSKSSTWWNQLEKYGSMVYLDAVMTVVENGIAKGSLSSEGIIKGEVYRDYNGIKSARAWAAPESLLGYFHIPVEFKSQIEPLVKKYTSDSVINIFLKTSNKGKVSYYSSEYDIEKGIPSGESVSGTIKGDKFIYDIRGYKNKGIVKIPVKVITDYFLKWYVNGIYKTEKKRVTRYYYVERDYEYYTLGQYDIKNLKSGVVELNGAVLKKNINTTAVIALKKYGNVTAHTYVPVYEIKTPDRTISSTSGVRPDIPNDNYKNLCEDKVKEVKVWNDQFSVDGITFFSDVKYSKKTSAPRQSASIKEVILNVGDFVISNKAKNGYITDKKGELIYSGFYGDNKLDADVASDIKVYTPVLIKGTMSSDKTLNQAVVPGLNQIVLGESFVLNPISTGEHIGIKGYGYRNYGVYIKKYYVSFPFDVILNGTTYKMNSLIGFSGEPLKLILPENVLEGKYKVKLYGEAVNSPYGFFLEGESGSIINNKESQYSVLYEMEVEVIGRLMGLLTETNLSVFRVKDMPFEEEGTNNLKLSLITIGHGRRITDYIKGRICFYYEDEDGNRSACIMKDDSTGKEVNRDILWKEKEKTTIYVGKYLWSLEYDIPKDYSFYENGKKLDQDIDIIVNIDIIAEDEKREKLSYINLWNFKKGYCNRWDMESDTMEGKEYGDLFIIKGKKELVSKYRILGIY